MANFFVPTRFTWQYGGSVVHLCGSFTRWVETVPMQMVPEHPEFFTVIVHLPPGYHQYKFIVDGEWRHDESQPFMPDPLGNVNNWLFVRRMEGEPPVAGIPIPHVASHERHRQQFHHPAVPQAQPQQQFARESPRHAIPANHLNEDSRRLQSQPSLSQEMSVDEGSNQLAQADVEMATADSMPGSTPVSYPSGQFSSPLDADEPQYTRRRIADFLNGHTCHELIPESGKVVLLDLLLPVRQAFHALHEQGVPSAPLWDAEALAVVGMISASDFIHVLRRLRNSFANGDRPMSEAEMDSLTIKDMREQSTADGRPPKALVYVSPDDKLQAVIQQLFDNRCSMAPVVVCQPTGSGDERGAAPMNTLLHIATISGILANLMRYFRASLSALPLLNLEVGKLPMGTWSPDANLPSLDPRFADNPQGAERRDKRKLRQLNSVHLETPLTTALSLLLDAGVSTLPVVGEDGALLDMYARSDITMLARGNSYSRLQWEDMTVGQALDLPQSFERNGSQSQPTSRNPSPRQSSEHQRQSPRASAVNVRSSPTYRVQTCTVGDNLRSVVERLSKPGVRRIFVVDQATRQPLGILSLSDVAAFLFDAI